ncbi:caspase family protein [Alicyclobacillus acidiphilus]|uniref:caspase family protein n=1 Tax=Alicyclobacillus acidiphilus TaxID=182455 RepID=UPI00083675CF|nr:caspase family protein [Alicyclobacillus acidiphilus]
MRKALIVGVDHYDNFNNLSGCVRDATEVATVLEFNGDGTRNFDVRTLVSSSDTITRSKLKESIELLFHGENDVALLYFSGHGTVTSTGGKIVTTDARRYDEGISMDEILTLANDSRSKDRIIILDCCFSGSFGSPAVTGGVATQLKDGVTVMTASRPDEPAIERGGQGVFTSLLVDGLQGSAADLRGYITPGSIYAYVDSALGAWEQRPVFKTSVSRFTHLRQIQPVIALDILRKLTTYFPSPEHEFPLNPTFEDTIDGFDPKNVAVFKELQKMVQVGLVKPVGEDHMYWAAVNSKSCRLSALGWQYWRMVKENRV